MTTGHDLMAKGRSSSRRRRSKLDTHTLLLAVSVLMLLAGSGCESAETLHEAAAEGDTERVRELILEGANVNELVSGSTSMFVAARYGHTETVTVLLEAGADVSKGFHATTPLSVALSFGHIETAEALIRAGADVNVIIGYDTPVLVSLAAAGRGEMVELVARAGADLSASGLYGTAVNAAAELATLRSSRSWFKRERIRAGQCRPRPGEGS